MPFHGRWIYRRADHLQRGGSGLGGQNTGAGASDLERRRHISEADPVR